MKNYIILMIEKIINFFQKGFFGLKIYNQLFFLPKIIIAIVTGYYNFELGVLLFVSVGSKTLKGIPVSNAMLNMGGMFSKSKTQLLPLAGVALGAQVRKYTYQPAGYGNVKYDSDNYTPGANKVFVNLRDLAEKKNQQGIYDTMYAVINNTNGIFTKNYGKSLKVLNHFINDFNKENPNNPITEKGYLDYHGYLYEQKELSFCNPSTQGIITNNLHEILAPKVIMEQSTNLLVERAFAAEGKTNLSGQKQPEYTIGIFSTETKDLVVYDGDLKTTDENSFHQKMIDLSNNQHSNVVKVGKDILGANIFIVATQGKEPKDVILTPEHTKLVAFWIKQKSQEHPQAFQNFNPDSLDFECFRVTGNTKYLNKLNVPSPRFLNPQDLKKVHSTNGNFEKSEVFDICMSDDD